MDFLLLPGTPRFAPTAAARLLASDEKTNEQKRWLRGRGGVKSSQK
jgi:hypothetical protein